MSKPKYLSTYYTKDTLQRLTETTVMRGGYGYKTTISYAPRQTKKWVKDDGPIQIIKGGVATPYAINGHWETTTVGTTNHVWQFREYDVSGDTATLIRSNAVQYDANGNITKYGDITYEYDKLNRLVRENNPSIDKTITWCYDVGGNIVSRTEYAYTTGTPSGGTTTNYTYKTDWKDQLDKIVVGEEEQQILYDQAGNPTEYMGKCLNWTRGRLLSTYATEHNALVATMRYDANGIRTQKNVLEGGHTTTTNYIYNGNNLIRETKSGTSSATKTYLYNSQGIIGFVYQGVTYTYRKNLFGDIIAIYNGATKVAEYAYDAYGNCTIKLDTNGIGTANPFRYRGYYYDTDLGFYYLMSRYYDPQTGRFINADTLDYLDPESINGLNLYAYCGNNPVMRMDPCGNFALWVFLGVVAISTFAGAIDGGVSAALSGQNFWKGFAAGAIGGAVGGIINYFLPGAGNLLGRAASTMIYDITNEVFQTGTFDINNLGIYVIDTIMDVGLSMLYLGKVGSIANSFISTAVGGSIDAGVDVIQTLLFFSPQAQQRIGKALTKIKELIQHRNRWRYAD